MFKKIEGSVQGAVIIQRSLGSKMEYKDIDVVHAVQYFNLEEEQERSQGNYGMTTPGRSKI